MRGADRRRRPRDARDAQDDRNRAQIEAGWRWRRMADCAGTDPLRERDEPPPIYTLNHR